MHGQDSLCPGSDGLLELRRVHVIVVTHVNKNGLRSCQHDATGAGDAFRAGFYAGMWKGMGIVDCAKIGSVVASFAVEKEGPQSNLPTWEQAMERLDASGI